MDSKIFNSLFKILLEEKDIEVSISQELEVWNDAADSNQKNINKFFKEFIFDYKDQNGIGINWVLFGDNNLSEINGEYSVIKRFTKCQSTPNIHIKTILNLKEYNFMNVHSPNREIVDTNHRKFKGAFNDKGLTDIVQLNHYACKTKEEFEHKCNRGRADFKTGRNINEFESLNFNEITDLTAYNFLYDNNNILNT